MKMETTAMMHADSTPTEQDWSFETLEETHASRLSSAPPIDRLPNALSDALIASIRDNSLVVAVDYDDKNPRATIQFGVSLELYHWFFNARTGHRAQFWISPGRGTESNWRCIQSLGVALAALPARMSARRIIVEGDYTRTDTDAGPIEIDRCFLERSLISPVAKIWICERLFSKEGNPVRELRPLENARPLRIARWKHAVAPCPPSDDAWLDVKGGFVKVYQYKDPTVRARDIHERGSS
jgi:hypothetical protein